RFSRDWSSDVCSSDLIALSYFGQFFFYFGFGVHRKSQRNKFAAFFFVKPLRRTSQGYVRIRIFSHGQGNFLREEENQCKNAFIYAVYGYLCIISLFRQVRNPNSNLFRLVCFILNPCSCKITVIFSLFPMPDFPRLSGSVYFCF